LDGPEIRVAFSLVLLDGTVFALFCTEEDGEPKKGVSLIHSAPPCILIEGEALDDDAAPNPGMLPTTA
jgi:hypothetical protein